MVATDSACQSASSAIQTRDEPPRARCCKAGRSGRTVHQANAARQSLIYTAMGWPLPVYAHIPLILGPDGKKLSKRFGSKTLRDYRDEGMTPDDIRAMTRAP